MSAINSIQMYARTNVCSLQFENGSREPNHKQAISSLTVTGEEIIEAALYHQLPVFSSVEMQCHALCRGNAIAITL